MFGPIWYQPQPYLWFHISIYGSVGGWRAPSSSRPCVASCVTIYRLTGMLECRHWTLVFAIFGMTVYFKHWLSVISMSVVKFGVWGSTCISGVDPGRALSREGAKQHNYEIVGHAHFITTNETSSQRI